MHTKLSLNANSLKLTLISKSTSQSRNVYIFPTGSRSNLSQQCGSDDVQHDVRQLLDFERLRTRGSSRTVKVSSVDKAGFVPLCTMQTIELTAAVASDCTDEMYASCIVDALSN